MPFKALDVTGERYARLTAVRRLPNKGRSTRWLFRCECGAETEASLGAVKSGAIKSCGCLNNESLRSRARHRMRHTATYRAWQGAKGRCLNPNNKGYENYGGRGIAICDRWVESFEAFLEDMGECPAGLSLDREDVNGNYEPGNCRWATRSQQNANVRGRMRIEHEGKRYSIKEFADLMQVDFQSLWYRLRKAGQDPHAAAAALQSGKWRRI
jgi:hypothetical protein